MTHFLRGDQGYTDRHAHRIYYVTAPETYDPPRQIHGEEQRREYTFQLLTDAAREYCNPFEIAHRLHGQEITASLSWNRYNDEDDYGEYHYVVAEKQYFRIASIQRLLIDLNGRANARLLGADTIFDYKKCLHVATSVSINEIEANVDDLIRNGHYSERQRALIQSNREMRDHIH